MVKTAKRNDTCGRLAVDSRREKVAAGNDENVVVRVLNLIDLASFRADIFTKNN